jgi:hypothetical protein
MDARRLWEHSLRLTEGLRKRDKASLPYRGEWCYALVHLARLSQNPAVRQQRLHEAREMLERLRLERNNPEDAYVLLLCELLQGGVDVKRSRASMLTEIKNGLAFFEQIRGDSLFHGLW